VSAFSDSVFAVIITIMVLDLKAPHDSSLAAVAQLWPALTSYAISYIFVAVVWVNHHHLLHYTRAASPRLIWANFAHLFAVSFVPFTTSWIADTRLAGVPVAFYAGTFFLVNLTYYWLIGDIFARDTTSEVTPSTVRRMRIRALCTLAAFGAAVVLSPFFPMGGMFLICLCLFIYLRPEAPVLPFWTAS
jgi:uncharacterized membrane protein